MTKKQLLNVFVALPSLNLKGKAKDIVDITCAVYYVANILFNYNLHYNVCLKFIASFI